MQYSYQTKGTCSREILFEVEDGITRLEGTTCGPKSTSCPDQLAQALKKAKAHIEG